MVRQSPHQSFTAQVRNLESTIERLRKELEIARRQLPSLKKKLELQVDLNQKLLDRIREARIKAKEAAIQCIKDNRPLKRGPWNE